jgi:hypothetical protein
MTPEQAFYLLTHCEKWPQGKYLPVVRRGGNPVRNIHDAGVVRRDNIRRVYTGIYLGDELKDAIPLDYLCPEDLLFEWKID